MNTKKILDAVDAVNAVRGTPYALYQAAERLALGCEFAGEEIWRRAEDARHEAFRLTNPDGRGEPMTQDERTAALSRLRSSLTQIRQLLAGSAS